MILTVVSWNSTQSGIEIFLFHPLLTDEQRISKEKLISILKNGLERFNITLYSLDISFDDSITNFSYFHRSLQSNCFIGYLPTR